MIWQITNPKSIAVEELNDAVMCFDRMSGETHLLTVLPGEILLLLQHKAYSESDLTQTLAGLCEQPNNENWHADIKRALNGLQRLNLVTKR